jgi:hypothetical protein
MKFKILLIVFVLSLTSCTAESDEIAQDIPVYDLEYETLEDYFLATDTEEYLFSYSLDKVEGYALAETVAFGENFGFNRDEYSTKFWIYSSETDFFVRRAQGPKDSYYGPFLGDAALLINLEHGLNSQRKSYVQQIMTGLEFYSIDNAGYPQVSGCVNDLDGFEDSLAIYLTNSPSFEDGEGETLCEDDFYYHSYGEAYVFVAELEDSIGMDFVRSENVYCDLPGESVFTEPGSVSELQTSLNDYDCSLYSKDRNVFYIVTRESN